MNASVTSYAETSNSFSKIVNNRQWIRLFILLFCHLQRNTIPSAIRDGSVFVIRSKKT
jgi:hypothetical protein